MKAAESLSGLHVSRETEEWLRHFEALLRKWNPAINLVARATLDQVWSRHILDSAQIYALDDTGSRTWVDLGSGGGFPGLVVAILAKGKGRDLAMTLVECDRRKAAFLMTVARELDLAVRVLDQRIEALPPLGAGVISARALAPLADLVAHAARHLAPDGLALFPKGANHAAEQRQALESWRFSYRATASVTEPDAVIYSIRGITRA